MNYLVQGTMCDAEMSKKEAEEILAAAVKKFNESMEERCAGLVPIKMDASMGAEWKTVLR